MTERGDQLSEKVVVLSIKGHVVLLEVLVESLCTQDLRDIRQLVVVIVPVEERLFAENLWTNEVNAGATEARPMG